MYDLFQEVVLMLTLTSDLPLCGKTDGAIIKQYNANTLRQQDDYLQQERPTLIE